MKVNKVVVEDDGRRWRKGNKIKCW